MPDTGPLVVLLSIPVPICTHLLINELNLLPARNTPRNRAGALILHHGEAAVREKFRMHGRHRCGILPLKMYRRAASDGIPVHQDILHCTIPVSKPTLLAPARISLVESIFLICNVILPLT